ncbi:DUF6272 family protein [Aurantibacillus circumpalustris]|uniref:DUF6272 family protein n=1 Tax=Aurantibacillus circumpalustris TaxID=3036359 RepID=UPI00295B4C73|nr:DUF6272 family protein [Aurantibacillus circumpalustris]
MNIDLTKNIYDRMVSQQFVMSIMGSFNQSLLLSLLNITDKKLSSLEIDGSIKKKIFHFMIECAQNLSRIEQSNDLAGDNIFLIGKNNDQYTVHLGTSMKSSETSKIQELLNIVNSLETEEVKTKFYSELVTKELVNQNPLLMSLLDISKKTKEKINYELIQIDEHSTFLSFKTTISNLKLTDGIYN